MDKYFFCLHLKKFKKSLKLKNFSLYLFKLLMKLFCILCKTMIQGLNLNKYFPRLDYIEDQPKIYNVHF